MVGILCGSRLASVGARGTHHTLEHAFLTDLVLLLAASIPIVLLLRRIKLPPLAGFLVAVLAGAW